MMDKEKRDFSLWRRYIDNNYTTDDVDKLREDIKRISQNDVDNDIFKQVWDESCVEVESCKEDTKKNMDEARTLLRSIETKSRFKFNNRITLFVSVAATVVLVVIVGLGYLLYSDSMWMEYKEISTAGGQHKEVVLPDGSKLILNSCSKIRYPENFDDDMRKIELHGEAFFNVARNEDKPFIVNTENFDVLVLGTSFNVKSYSSDEIASVEVESGKVQVEMPEGMVRLVANEQVLLNTYTGEYSKKIEDSAVATWRKGTLTFDSTPFNDVIMTLERNYDCKITINGGHKFDNIISGEHDNKNLESVLQSIKFTTGVDYKINDNEVVLYKK